MLKKTYGKILASLLVFSIILCFSFLMLEVLNMNKIILGLELAGMKIGGLEPSNAEKNIQEKFIQWENGEILMKHNSQQFSVKPKEIGIYLDIDKTINQAYNFGREKNILLGLYRQVSAILPLANNKIIPVYSFNESQFKKFTEKNFALYENPAQNATLEYNFRTKKWEAVEESPGKIFDREKIKKDLIGQISILSHSPIQLSLVNDIPEVSISETGQAKEKAEQAIANAPYLLKYNDKTWPIDKETLVDWLEFTPVSSPPSPLDKGGIKGGSNKILGVSLNQEKIKNVLTEFTPYINQEPINAQLATQDGKVVAFALSQDGISLNIEKSAEKIEAELLKPHPNPLLEKEMGKDELIELIVDRKTPPVSTESIDTLGLTALIGKGESNFAGSPKNRMHNIKTGAAKISGTLIAPNEEFSFNQVLGEIGPKQGYLPELVIKNHKTIPEYGGGICQVSTTAFRAAINSGLKITERFPHAFPVKYYNPQGFDSTIYPPHPDLRFINDTPRYILMQSKVEGTKITFEFYGTNDSREVKVKGPTTLQSNPDGSMKTILYQEIWRNGQMERQAKFPSNYKSPDLYPREEKNPLE